MPVMQLLLHNTVSVAFPFKSVHLPRIIVNHMCTHVWCHITLITP